MRYLISAFGFWLVLALLLGLAIGWITCLRGNGRGWRGLLPWLVLIALGALAAWAQILPTRLGLWLDLAVLMLAAYVIGACLGCLLRQLLGAGAAEPAARQAAPAPVMATPVAPVSVAARSEPVLAPGERAVEPMAPVARAAPEPAEALEEAITGLSAPRGGQSDDLTRIYAVDAETAKKLNALGIYHFDQLAALTPGQRRWLFRQLGHEGRFPSWWWRWRHDAEQILAGRDPMTEAAAPVPAPAMAAAAPVALAAVAPAAPALEGTRPAGLAAPRGGKADDLKRIRGIGKQNEGRLHGLGIWHFDQIAAWSADEALWVGGYLAFPGRIEREDWISQARILATGAETAFSKRVDAGQVATSKDDTDDDGQANVAVPGKDFAPRKPDTAKKADVAKKADAAKNADAVKKPASQKPAGKKDKP